MAKTYQRGSSASLASVLPQVAINSQSGFFWRGLAGRFFGQPPPLFWKVAIFSLSHSLLSRFHFAAVSYPQNAIFLVPQFFFRRLPPAFSFLLPNIFVDSYFLHLKLLELILAPLKKKIFFLKWSGFIFDACTLLANCIAKRTRESKSLIIV